MSVFLNNTSKVAQVQVRVYNVNELEIHSDILNVVRSVMCSVPWLETNLEDVSITQLRGGLSNILYLVHHLETGLKVIVRVFGVGTSDFIDRATENIVFSKLSKGNVGPIFHGLFENGRVEGFLEARNLDPSEMQLASIYPMIASSVCRLHHMNIPEIYESDDWLWRKTDQLFALAAKISFESGSVKQRMLEQVELCRIREEFEWLKSQINRIHATALAARDDAVGDDNTEPRSCKNAGRLYGFDTVVCHNDLLSGNLMLSLGYDISRDLKLPPHERDAWALSHMTLIDFEYASYNFRAFDLANHFVEHTGVELSIPETFPSKQFRLRFLKAYVESAMIKPHGTRGKLTATQIDPTANFLGGIEEVVCLFLLQVHIFWGVWSVVQSGSATIDFDYLAYAELRNKAYAHQKREFSYLFES